MDRTEREDCRHCWGAGAGWGGTVGVAMPGSGGVEGWGVANLRSGLGRDPPSQVFPVEFPI